MGQKVEAIATVQAAQVCRIGEGLLELMIIEKLQPRRISRRFYFSSRKLHSGSLYPFECVELLIRPDTAAAINTTALPIAGLSP